MCFLPKGDGLAGHLDNLAAETPCGRLPGEERQKACRHGRSTFWTFLGLYFSFILVILVIESPVVEI